MPDYCPRLLILTGKHVDQSPLADKLRPLYDLDVVGEAAAALSALRQGHYDAVMAAVGDFLPLERAAVSDQAHLVLDTIGEGVCVVDQAGHCVWANKRMAQIPEGAFDKSRQICQQAVSYFNRPQNAPDNGASASVGEATPGGGKKFSFQVGEDRHFELIASPIPAEQGGVHRVVALVWEATAKRRLQQKINAIDSAGRELARLESDAVAKLSPGQRLELLREKIIQYSRDLMQFDHFAIRVFDKRANKLELVIGEGMPPEAMAIELYVEPEGNGISGYVAATGRSYICHDVEKDPRYVLGLQHCKSSLTVPLMLHDKVIGVFNIESQRPHAFDEDDRQFAEIFGRYVAIALNILDLLVVERYTTSGLVAESVVQEMAEPLNDILVDAESLLDGCDPDDARDRIQRILQNARNMSSAVRDVASGPNVVLGSGQVSAVYSDPILGSKRVLVADDEPNIRNTIRDILRKHGCDAALAKDGFEAAMLLEQRHFDLIISDIKMPYRNGYEIFSASKRKDPDVPVILMTGFGYDPSHSIVRASQEGLSAVLFKPFKVDQLLDEVRKALQQNATEPAE